MIEKRRYQGQAPDSSFDNIEIGNQAVRNLREFNQDNESTLREVNQFNRDQRQTRQNQIENNQRLEAQNRRENFEFQQANEKLYFDAINRNNQQKVTDAQRAFQAFDAKNNPLAQLSQFSQSLSQTLVQFKTIKDKQDENDQYWKTMSGLSNGDIGLATLQQQEITRSNNGLDSAAAKAQVAGLPLETVKALKDLKGGRRIGAAKALAEAVLRRWPATLEGFLATSDQLIEYTDPITKERKSVSPRSAQTGIEIGAVSQWLARKTYELNGLTEVNPSIVAPFFKKMLEHNQSKVYAYDQNARKALASTDVNKTLVDLKVNLTTNGAAAIPPAIETLAVQIDPETLMPIGRAGARELILKDLGDKASINSAEGIRYLEILRAYSAAPAPEYLRGNKDLTNGDIFPDIDKTIGEAIRTQNQYELAENTALDLQQERDTTALIEETKNSGIVPSVKDLQDLQQRQRDTTGKSDPRLDDLITKAQNKEKGIPQQRKELEAYVSNNSLTSDILAGFDPELQEDFRNAAKRGDALKAQVVNENSTFNTWLSTTSRALEGIKDTTSLASPQMPLARQQLEADVIALAKEIQDASDKPMSFDAALSQAMQQYTQLLSPLTTGVDITSEYNEPINMDSLDVRASKYYWDPVKKTFPNLFGTSPEINLERLYELDNLVQQGGEKVFETQAIISREQALAASNPNAPIPSIIPRLRRQLPKGSTLSDWDLLQMQQRYHKVEVRQKPYAQQVVEQNITPLQAELLYRTPTSNRTTRYGIDSGLGAGKERAGIAAIATNLGVDPIDLAAIIDYETAGALTSGSYRSGLDIYGGDQGLYLGWIQFSPANAAKYGVRRGMTAAQQAEAVTGYLRDNGVQPGDPIHVIYQAIQAPAYVQKARETGRNYLSDSNGPVGGHVKNIIRRRNRVGSWYQYQPGEQSSAFADPRYRSINSTPYDNV